MKTAITGLSNSGKTTVFNALTGLGVPVTVYPGTGGRSHIGVVKVPDKRLDTLSGIFKPKKTTLSTVEYVDYVGFTKGDMKQNRSVFEVLKDADALVHVVRAFQDDAVMHPLGGVDPVRDAATLEAELLFGDLELVEQRLKGIELSKKKGRKPDEAERKALLKCRDAIEGGSPLRDVRFTDDELGAMRHLQFMSIKPEVVLINIEEKDLNTDKAVEVPGRVTDPLERVRDPLERVRDPLERVRDSYRGDSPVSVLTLCGKAEMEIAELAPDERGAFLEDLGIQEPAVDKLIRVAYGLLGLISFFTIGGDEVRAWAIRKGTDALTAAGKVHTDIQRGFIRAEVVAYDDFIRLGGLGGARAEGLLRLEGKTYEVRDGDIIDFRFNV